MSFVIPSEFTAVDHVSRTMVKMSNAVMSFANVSDASLDRVDRKFRKIQNTSFNVSQKAGLMGAAIAAPLVLASNSAVKFEAKMSNVATLLDTTEENMESMGNEVLKLTTRLPVPIEELTTSLFDIRSAGVSADNAMATLEASAKLSAAGLATTEEATNILTSAMNAFASEGLSATEIADILFKTTKFGKTTVAGISQAFGATAPIIQSAGVTLRDFSAATSALTTLGTPAAQAQNQIRAAITALIKPTADMEKIFKKLGVKTGQDLIKRMGGMEGAFQAVKKASKEMNVNVADAFGSVEALGAVTSLTGSTNKAYVNTLKNMTTGTEALTEAFDKQASTSKAQMQLFKNNIETVSVTIGNALLPMINKLIERVQPMIEQFIDWMRANKETVKTIVKVTAVVGGLMFAVSAGAFIIGAFSKAVLVATTIFRVFRTVMVAIRTAQLALNLAMMANPAGLFVAAIVALIAIVVIAIKKFDSFGAVLLMLLGPFGRVIALVMTFRRNWDMLTKAFKDGGIVGGIKAIGKVLLDFLLLPIQQLLKLVSYLPDFLGGGLAEDAAKKIEGFRAGLDLNVGNGNVSVDDPAPVINPKIIEQESLVRRLEASSESNVNINIKDPNNRVDAESDSPSVSIKTTSTMD